METYLTKTYLCPRTSTLFLYEISRRICGFYLDTSTSDKGLLSLWKKVGQRIQHLHQQLKHAESAQMFSFVEGALVRAIKQGDWVLLDEINLATPETLECLNGVLESQQGSVVVLERGYVCSGSRKLREYQNERQ